MVVGNLADGNLFASKSQRVYFCIADNFLPLHKYIQTQDEIKSEQDGAELCGAGIISLGQVEHRKFNTAYKVSLE